MKVKRLHNSPGAVGKLKKAAICAVFLVVALLLCGCMKMHVEIIWREDNSASISTTIGLQKSALTMFDMTEEDIQSQLKESMVDDGIEYTFKDFSDKDYAGIIATMESKDITKASSETIEGLNFKCTESGKTKTYTVTGSVSGSDIAGDSESLTESGVSLGDVDMRISINMPGKIISNNATEKSGNTLTWVLDPTSTTLIQASSESSGSGGALPMILLIVGIVVLLGVGAAILLILRKNKAAEQVAYPTYGGTAPGYDPYQTPGAQQQSWQQPEQQPQYQQPEYQPAPQQSWQQPEQQPQYQQPEYQPAPQQPWQQPEYQPQYQQPEYQPAPQQPVQDEPAAQQSDQAAYMKLCPNCGAELPENAKFCTVCGASTSV